MKLRFDLSRRRKLFLLVVFVCYCCQAQDNELNKLVRYVSEWGDELNSDSTTLEPHLMTTQVRDGHNYGVYDFYLKGAPSDQTYTLFQWPLSKPAPETVMPAYVSNNGRLCMNATDCHDATGPYVLLALFAAPGLPHRIGIASEDKKFRAAALVVPNPVVGEDKGCKVEVIRVREDFSLAVIKGKGFQPNNEIHYSSNSAGEKLKGSFKANEKGEFSLGFGPGVKGKQEGTDKIEFKAPGCAPSASYHWGALEK